MIIWYNAKTMRIMIDYKHFSQAADPIPTIADLQTIIQSSGFTKLPEFLGRPQLIFEIIIKDLINVDTSHNR